MVYSWKNKSRMLLSLVGEFTSCVKQQSADICNKDWFITRGYLCWDTESVSQSISGRLKSPVQQMNELGFLADMSVIASCKFCAYSVSLLGGLYAPIIIKGWLIDKCNLIAHISQDTFHWINWLLISLFTAIKMPP